MILTVGDSFTYGAELADREQDAWPFVLGRELNLDVENLAVPAGSNDRTFRVAVNKTASNNYKLVICGWTEVSRIDTTAHGEELQITSASTWLHDKFPWVKDYYANHYSEQLAQETWLTKVIALQDFFKQRNQKYIFVNMNGYSNWETYFNELGLTHLVEQIDKSNYIEWPNNGFTAFVNGAPLGPNGHPLELGHQRIADKIYEHIRNIGWVS